MTALVFADKARMYIQRLCRDIPTRRVGSHGNRLATDFFAETVAAFGFQTTRPSFDCTDWTSDGARLSVNGISFPASASPYSLGCHVQGPLLAAATIDELEAVEARSSVPWRANSRWRLLRQHHAIQSLRVRCTPSHGSKTAISTFHPSI
jgi:hypothetical protein